MLALWCLAAVVFVLVVERATAGYIAALKEFKQ